LGFVRAQYQAGDSIFILKLSGIKQALHAILLSPAFKAKNGCNEIRPTGEQAEKSASPLLLG
jgi:hypothetical protein